MGGKYTKNEVQVLWLLMPLLVFFNKSGEVLRMQIGKSKIFCSYRIMSGQFVK